MESLESLAETIVRILRMDSLKRLTLIFIQSGIFDNICCPLSKWMDFQSIAQCAPHLKSINIHLINVPKNSSLIRKSKIKYSQFVV